MTSPHDSLLSKYWRSRHAEFQPHHGRHHAEINWILKFDQISEDLEKLLLKLRENLKGWFFQWQFVDDEVGGQSG